MVAEASLGDTLQRVSDTTLRALPSAEVVGLSMLGDDGRPTTAIYTDEMSPEVDAAQYDAGNGPCLDAWRRKCIVRVDDMRRALGDYPEFAQSALDHGILSTLSLPLIVADRGVGAMNLYARVENGFSEEDELLGSELATTAAVVMSNAEAYWRVYELSENMAEAMKTRAVIEQAKGMLMACSPELGPEEAFEALRKASQRENVKLRDIARRIVARERPSDGSSP
jgi:GAF domain-containing protein